CTACACGSAAKNKKAKIAEPIKCRKKTIKNPYSVGRFLGLFVSGKCLAAISNNVYNISSSGEDFGEPHAASPAELPQPLIGS
ncbi:MAG: hypothetical protein COB53_05035, partial [Elusimicrobia bacterium]